MEELGLLDQSFYSRDFLSLPPIQLIILLHYSKSTCFVLKHVKADLPFSIIWNLAPADSASVLHSALRSTFKTYNSRNSSCLWITNMSDKTMVGGLTCKQAGQSWYLKERGSWRLAPAWPGTRTSSPSRPVCRPETPGTTIWCPQLEDNSEVSPRSQDFSQLGAARTSAKIDSNNGFVVQHKGTKVPMVPTTFGDFDVLNRLKCWTRLRSKLREFLLFRLPGIDPRNCRSILHYINFAYCIKINQNYQTLSLNVSVLLMWWDGDYNRFSRMENYHLFWQYLNQNINKTIFDSQATSLIFDQIYYIHFKES